MAKDQVKVRFCPKCKSFRVKYVQGFWNALGLIPKQRCLDCGYEAPIFPILVTDKKTLEEKTKVKKKIVRRTKGIKKKVVKKVLKPKKKIVRRKR